MTKYIKSAVHLNFCHLNMGWSHNRHLSDPHPFFHAATTHGYRGMARSVTDGLPVWLRLCTINTLGPMQTIPQISHLSFPLGSRIPPAEEKALASGLGCEPFTLAPEASTTRKSSAHSSSSTPFMSQASPFSSSLRASTLMLQAGKEGRDRGEEGHGLEHEHVVLFCFFLYDVKSRWAD